MGVVIALVRATMEEVLTVVEVQYLSYSSDSLNH